MSTDPPKDNHREALTCETTTGSRKVVVENIAAAGLYAAFQAGGSHQLSFACSKEDVGIVARHFADVLITLETT